MEVNGGSKKVKFLSSPRPSTDFIGTALNEVHWKAVRCCHNFLHKLTSGVSWHCPSITAFIACACYQVITQRDLRRSWINIRRHLSICYHFFFQVSTLRSCFIWPFIPHIGLLTGHIIGSVEDFSLLHSLRVAWNRMFLKGRLPTV
jgi:hypothetical protein